MMNVSNFNSEIKYLNTIKPLPPKKKKNERRRHFRIQQEKNHPIGVHINGENFIEMIRANDISIGGIGLIVPHEFKGCKIDRMVYLVITLPFPVNKSFKTKGIIRHVIGKRFGVKFVGIQDSAYRLIRKYVSYRLKASDWLTKLKFKFHLI